MTDPVARPVDNPLSAVAAPTFDRYYYTHFCGIPYERNDHWVGFFDDLAERIVLTYNPSSVLDGGCALGFLVEALRKRGVDAYGVDVSEYAISQVHPSIAPYCTVASLPDGLPDHLPATYDLVTCIEVIEHIPGELEARVLRTLTDASDQVYFTSSPTDFSEVTHFNVHPPEYWSARMAELGFYRHVEAPLLLPAAPWGAVFRRGRPPRAAIVEGYERELWRLRSEVSDVRGTALRLKEQVSEADDGETREQLAATSSQLAETREQLAATSTQLAETHEQLATTGAQLTEAREQILNLRDAVIGAEAELGELRGAVHVLNCERDAVLREREQATRDLESIVLERDAMAREREAIERDRAEHALAVGAVDRLEAVLRSRSWRVTQAILAPVRWVRQRRDRRS